MYKARAAIADGKGGFFFDTVTLGKPAAGEVKIKIKASGICHTDWDSIKTWNKKFIIGHEGAGVIVELGENVKDLGIGDKVILNWAIPCGECFQCQEGNLHICEVNSPVTGNGLCGHANEQGCQHNGSALTRSFHLGTMSEYTIVKAAAVIKINSNIDFPSASIVGCGVMTGYGSVVNAAKVNAGASVAVLGCGGVGLNVIQGAAISGAAKIIAIDLSLNRLAQAKEFGATHTVLADKDDPDLINMVTQVKALTHGRGADFAFECTAVPALGSAPLALIRSAGVAVQVSGIEQKIDFDCTLFEWDKIYINPLYGQCNPKRDFGQILQLYDAGKLKLDELVTKTYTLAELQSGFDDMLAGRIAKGVIVFED
ncbi:Zn-dependent alcohol dehydrogenase [Shewanella olleyana]|uniref:Zn-dependent alcohol dehydrogenase n=1 Tax=Shewanella olleyana TaxID=135626 RepID=UPI00200E1907|nr:Zn-dependent alcohol dehydrogenase [Shewanella olleyana]MCL1065652.1 Zn-dependent alcohol dehydrogenase [Shewanella olleyana]